MFTCYWRNQEPLNNWFLAAPVETNELPEFSKVKPLLPQPAWAGHQDAIDCYWKAWEIAFRNLRRPTAQNGFVANYLDTAFNGHLFLWDSVFAARFGRYASRVFDFQQTLDNLYVKQHPDGFICREIDETDGQDCFHRHDPNSTGPNVFAWSEWEHYGFAGDEQRLRRVLPVLVAYHRWMRRYRTWPDGSYWATGWACGNDNTPRGPNCALYHDHLHWIDACAHAALSARMIRQIANHFGEAQLAGEFYAEFNLLHRYINEHMWDESAGFYFDLLPDGSRSNVKFCGAYWTLLAGVVPPDRLRRFVEHLDDPKTFNRPHRVPTLAADHPKYDPAGGYHQGGVWPLVNDYIVAGLRAVGFRDLARDIALNHHRNVVEVFNKTNTIWENYAPESAAPGNPAMADFVGFSGLPPIAGLLEAVMGLHPDAPAHKLVWEIHLLEAHSVKNYPLGKLGLLDLHCNARSDADQQPAVRITSSVPLEVELRWPGGQEIRQIRPAP